MTNLDDISMVIPIQVDPRDGLGRSYWYEINVIIPAYSSTANGGWYLVIVWEWYYSDLKKRENNLTMGEKAIRV